jgi:hypothetical protein
MFRQDDKLQWHYNTYIWHDKTLSWQDKKKCNNMRQLWRSIHTFTSLSILRSYFSFKLNITRTPAKAINICRISLQSGYKLLKTEDNKTLFNKWKFNSISRDEVSYVITGVDAHVLTSWIHTKYIAPGRVLTGSVSPLPSLLVRALVLCCCSCCFFRFLLLMLFYFIYIYFTLFKFG